MKSIIFDIETDGFWQDCTKIHCIVCYSVESKKLYSYPKNEIDKGLELLKSADLLIGHNIIDFDIPVIDKLYGSQLFKKKVFDTFIVSQMLFSDLYNQFGENEYKLPGKLKGSHSLSAWGYRLQCYKGEYNGPWTHWNKNMQDYCEQDVKVTTKLYSLLLKEDYCPEAVNLELETAKVFHRINKHGFYFDEKKGLKLFATLLQEKEELRDKLVSIFGKWYDPVKLVIPKRNMKRKNDIFPSMYEQITKDCSYTRIKLIEFNPNSRPHIRKRLKVKYNWKPIFFTDTGLAKIDDDVLNNLQYPEGKDLARYFMIEKRLQALATADKAWLKVLGKDKRIHGSMKQNGARTGRVIHFNPNLSQVTATGKPFGKECRELFCATPGKVLVGCDADGLELRCLAGYMETFDNGLYIKAVSEGNKENKTDIHSLNAISLNMDRNMAKTVMYALIYGASDWRLGFTYKGHLPSSELKKIGKRIRSDIIDTVKGLGDLLEKVHNKYNNEGYLLGLDGRKLFPSSEHSALNVLLQSAGAIIMKKSVVILDKTLKYHGLICGDDYEFVGFIHDELQIECKPDLAERIGKCAVKSIIQAGKSFSFPCPMDGEYKIGTNWSETH